MARRRSTSYGSTRAVTVIGHNSQVLSTVLLFVGGDITVTVVTADESLEDTLAPYPGVTVLLVADDYAEPPTAMAPTAFFLCVDSEDLAHRIRSWLPQTLAVFHLGAEHRGRTHANGFLRFTEAQSDIRRDLLQRLSTIRRVDRLIDLARQAAQPLILMYGDPDPDAIGAALGLATIMRTVGATPAIRYTGEVQRYQNKLMIGYLKEPIGPLTAGEREAADLLAVVDAQPGFWKTDPPPADIVIDHHPVVGKIDAAYVDLREDYGSTVTILTEYLCEADIPIRRKLATALLYGLMTDTADLTRHTTSADIRAYDVVHGRADHYFLARLAKSVIPANLLDHMGWGIAHRIVFRDLILIHYGEIENPDLLVQSADNMLLTCGINWVVCAAKVGDRLVVVFRSDGHRIDVGKRARVAFAKIGSAGGHRTMGRAEIPLHGAHVDTTVPLLIDNLFRRMGDERRASFIRTLRNHLHGAGPQAPLSLPQT